MEDKKELIKKLQNVLTLHERMRHCYMFSSPSTAAKRRGYEYYNSLDTEFEYKGNHYRITQDTSCSCAHVYYYINYFMNGRLVKKDIRFVKKLLQELQSGNDET